MPQCPHFWSLRKQWADSRDFTTAVLRIRQLGTRRKFRTMRNLYLEVGDWSYWTMDNEKSPPEVCMLINRARRQA
jgi:hypothetical protein